MPAIDVAAALIFRRGNILIAQRHPGAHLGSLWEFPGGKREEGESFEDCLRRELKEELGIEVEVGELVETIEHAYPEKTVHLKFFRCAWTKHKLQRLGCLDFRWITREELSQFTFPAADARLLQKLRDTAALWELSDAAGP